MKTLYIIRHAKSDWENFNQTDFDRALNERGNKDAKKMAARLLKKNVIIDTFISSTAIRAKETCEHFCKVYNVPISDINFIDKLYHASSPAIYEVVDSIDNKFNHAAIFCHNPGITDFANTLISKVRLDNMPTCGIFALKIDTDDWKEFEASEKKFLFFDYPKQV